MVLWIQEYDMKYLIIIDYESAMNQPLLKNIEGVLNYISESEF